MQPLPCWMPPAFVLFIWKISSREHCGGFKIQFIENKGWLDIWILRALEIQKDKGQTWSWSMAEKASWPRLPVPAHKSYLLTGKTKRCRNELTTDTMCFCFGNLSTRGKKTLQCHAKTKVGKKNRREPATHTYILGPSLLRAKIKRVSTWDTEAVNTDQRFALKNFKQDSAHEAITQCVI